jgi:6-phosphogluconolactonase
MHVFEKETQLYEALSSFFIRKAESHPGDYYVALSGGNTPKTWFDYLAGHKKGWAGWSKIHFFWGDERCVPPDSDESNYGMAKRHLFDEIESISSRKVHRIRGELDPVAAAELYRDELYTCVPAAHGAPKFDLVLLGLGTDGHTASLFPDRLDLWNNASLCVSTEHPGDGQSRISLTGRVINNAVDIVFLVQGEGKADVLGDIIHERPGYADYPAAHVRPVHGALHWYVDAEAAKKLQA